MQTIKKIDAAALRAFTEAAFKAYGFVPDEAAQITDVLMAADLCGVDTHGSQRLEMYRQHINGGFVRIGAQPETVFETPVSAVVDGHATMGQLVARYAMQIAIDKAKQSGIGMVSVRNSNHYGIAAYYSSMAASQGLVGISMTNSFPIVVPTYGRTPMMGTNPIAVAIPASPTDFSLDAATSVVAFGKPEVYLKKGLTAPLGWAINSQGVDETDPQIIVECVRQGLGGGMYPLGGSSELFGSHKGYGYAVLVEFFSACLSQCTTSVMPKPSAAISAPTCKSCANRRKPPAKNGFTSTAKKKPNAAANANEAASPSCPKRWTKCAAWPRSSGCRLSGRAWIRQ